MAEPKRITITLEPESRDITVAPTSAHVRAGDAIEWHAEDVTSFVVIFRDGAAVEHVDGEDGGVEIRSSTKDGRLVARGVARGAKGYHHYQVTICRGEQVFADVGCPSIIIR